MWSSPDIEEYFSKLSITPQGLGDSADVGDHDIVAVEGNFTSLVWECRHCHERATDGVIFRDFPCVES